MRDRISSVIVVAVLTALSGAGAFLLFKLLESQATVRGTWYEVSGAAAGFIVIYWMLDRSFRRIAQPSLTGEQTLDLIHLFQETSKYKLLRQAFVWIDEREAGEEIPAVEARLRILDGIRHEPRQFVTGFSTPFANLNKHMESKAESPYYREALAEAMRIIDSDEPPQLKRKRLWELADSAKNQLYNTYVQDLRQMK